MDRTLEQILSRLEALERRVKELEQAEHGRTSMNVKDKVRRYLAGDKKAFRER